MITPSQARNLSPDAVRLAAAREAVGALGLLKPEAEGTILHLLDDRFMVAHPRKLCIEYRKDGEQLTADELRSLGVKSNAFMSRRAFGQLTEAGLGRPLEAHEITLLRATFTLNRHRSLLGVQGLKPPAFNDEFKYDTMTRDCAVCRSLDAEVVKGDDVHVFPPPGCVCETANYTIRPYVDFLRGIR